MTVFKFGDSVTPGVNASARKGKGRMKPDELQSIMHDLVNDAINLTDGELSPERAKATDYYLGLPFGNEEPGRSSMVVTEVRDTVHGLLPSLLRIFTAPEHVVSFAARTEQNVPIADQATDYVNYVFMEENEGFLRMYDVLKDGLVRKIGGFRWYWEADTKKSYREEGISDDDLQELAKRDDVELTLIEEDEDEGPSYAEDAAPEAPDASEVQAAQQGAPQPGAPDPSQQEAPAPEKRWTVEYTVTLDGSVCVVALPPEEILFDREARSQSTAMMVAHRTRKRRGDLLSLGISEADLDEYGDVDWSLGTNVEAVERNSNFNIQQGHNPPAGHSNDLILYIEAYVYLDVDGDGVSELRRVCMIGENYHVVLNEPASGRPFSLYTPIPEPHTIVGQSVADLTMDLQYSKSMVTRAVSDSLALSIYPRTAFVEGQVSVEDILNSEIGAPIRMRAPGMVQPFTHDFTGAAAMPVLEYFDQIGENRTGRKSGPVALDSDALQSSTAEAVNAAVTAGQEQVEMYARIFAEQTLKPLFRGIYGLLVQHRPAQRIVKLRGQYVPINTDAWDSEMDVTVNVALGTSNVAQRIAVLQGIAAKQEQVLSTLGPGNPMVSLAQYANTLRKLTELGGERAVSNYFSPVDPSWQPPPAPPPPPTPEQVIAQAQVQNEQLKTAKDLEIKRAELTLKQQDQIFQQQLATRKFATDAALRLYAINAQFHSEYTIAQLEADADSDANALDGALKLAGMRHDHKMDKANLALAAAAAMQPDTPDDSQDTPQDPNDGTPVNA